MKTDRYRQIETRRPDTEGEEAMFLLVVPVKPTPAQFFDALDEAYRFASDMAFEEQLP